ncbi:MAG: hypothetical protein M1818_004239 [Claussenomyces sp. TS43310]|nr:MAG: hypothetical protein M1818_004239 [Claussenomyces sp. TS43310]
MSGQRLTGQSFLSQSSLPDVKLNTKIVGVCGISDWNESGDAGEDGEASPRKDGWFFSDFYLFHHLFRDVASDQRNMANTSTAVLPLDLSDVVLDRDMLDDLNDVRVVPDDALLERVLATIHDSRRVAMNENRPFLILIFTHGRKGTYSLLMGGGDPANAPRLTMQTFKEAIGSRPLNSGLCLVTTACFSGGWAINPNLNITSLTAQPAWNESLAWPISGAFNTRSCGSPFASAIADTLLRLTIDGFGVEEEEYFDRTPTYAGLIDVVRDTVQSLDPRSQTIDTETESTYSVHQPMFSAQDDEWEMAYSTRTGFPLNVFQARWLKLKAAESRQPPPGGEHLFGPGSQTLSRKQLASAVRREGRLYLESKPGDSSKGKNLSLHNSLNLFLDGRTTPSVSELVYLQAQIDYRLNQVMAAATMYKNFLDLNLADCHMVEMDKYPKSGTSRWIAALELVETYPLSDKPCRQSHEYSKGDEYLAAGGGELE